MQARQHTTEHRPTAPRAARPRHAARRQVNGAPARPPPLLTAGALAAWAAEMDVDPAAVGLDDEGYPYCDGEPMSQNERQFKELVRLGDMLLVRYRRRPDVFVGGDVFVHHEENERLASAAPDLCVAFDTAVVGDRMSYKLWEPGHPPPDFAMEVLSPRTKRNDMGGRTWVEGAPFTARTPGKPGRYARMGIGEFWLYDPFGSDIPPRVAGYRLEGGVYRPLPRRPDGAWRSEALGLDMRLDGDALRLRDVATGRDIRDLAEEREAHGREREAHRREREAHDETKAEVARLRAELERLRGP